MEVTARYRIAGLVVNPVLLLDDGEDLVDDGTRAQPIQVSMADIAGSSLHERLVRELQGLNDARDADAEQPPPVP